MKPQKTNLFIYSVKPAQLDEILLRRLADKFSVTGQVKRIREETLGQSGFSIKETNQWAPGKLRTVYFWETTGNFGYDTGDDGYRYNSITKRHEVFGVPEKEEAKRMALELLPVLGLSTNDLEHYSNGRVRWASTSLEAEAEADPAGARERLRQSGHAGGFDVELDYLRGPVDAIARLLATQLAEVGIGVKIQQHDSGTFWTLGDQKAGDSWKRIQLIIGRFSMQPDPSWATTWFIPEQIGVWNWERWNSPEFGELEVKAKVELDAKKRHDMYVRMQDLMEESGSYVFLTHEAVGVAHRSGIEPAVMPNGTPIFHQFKST
jgi:hypothetical protein